MKLITIGACVVLLCIACSPIGAADAGDQGFDALGQLTARFPKSIELNQRGNLLEFCPDNTCDGFVAGGGVPVAELKDFAYLYVYFFSEFAYLQEWRDLPAAKSAADRVLSKVQYRNCRKGASREVARCVLRDLSRDGRVKLIFIRYDEGSRNVVPQDLAVALSDGGKSRKP